MLLKIGIRWFVFAGTFLLIAKVVPGIVITSAIVALIVAAVWGVVMLVVRPILILLTLPINILTLGVFTFVLNALLFWLVAGLVPGFTVQGFIPALQGSVILMLVGWALHAIL